jgi:hypothetical protein
VHAHAGTRTCPSPPHAQANGHQHADANERATARSTRRWVGVKEAPYLDHENLDVYRCHLLAHVVAMLTKMTR